MHTTVPSDIEPDILPPAFYTPADLPLTPDSPTSTLQLELDKARHELWRLRRENEQAQAVQSRLKALEANFRLVHDSNCTLRRDNEKLIAEVERLTALLAVVPVAVPIDDDY